MRIICTVTNDLSHDQRMHRICGSLQGAGHSVTLVGRELPDSPALPDRPYHQHRLKCRYLRGKRFYAEYNLRLWRLLRGWEFDVICAADLDTLPAGSWLTRARGKLVYDAHEWFSETPEVFARPLVRGLWRGLGKALVPHTDARYTVGPELARQLEVEYRMPFAVVRNLPSRVEFPKHENTGGVILYQGMLNPGRGLEVAMAALSDLPGCKLWIVGSGPERQALEALAQRTGVADRVWFAGFRPPHELPEITRNAWLGINLLEASSPSYYFSLANKSLDYVQAGLPSVQMDFPEYRNLQERYHCFSLLPELTAPALAAVIQGLRDNKPAYDRLRHNCELAAEELCWEREEPRLLEIYEGLERER
ncbi:glycosyltransferase family 4 protein [Neolewinella litorea]|uniref:Glycosyltransferase n=1 Tax=Neolewinella litorea TaxID=2562452 RepID=A0A4S4NST7_9BACT|nr:glycosyltransferase family 4 protein [Neolewinella litorea]THH41531.1 glycosyltransferase [Neolewinella litorea]